MNPRAFVSQRKTHLVFVGAFLLVLFFNITLGPMSGESVLGATWRGFSEIRPMEYAIFAAFWYAFAVYRPKDDWGSSFISLNLSGLNNQK
jgi:hypothetical protein